MQERLDWYEPNVVTEEEATMPRLSNEQLQEDVRRLGSHLMRDGLTVDTVAEIVSFSDAFSTVPKADRAALYDSAKQEARPRAKPATVVDHPEAQGTIGPIRAKGAKSLGAQSAQSTNTASALATCSCSTDAYVLNPTKVDVWVAKHEQRGEGHVVTRR